MENDAATPFDDLPDAEMQILPEFANFGPPEDIAEPDDPPARNRPKSNGAKVLPLGHDHGVFYYYSTESRQRHALTAGDHTRGGLSGMASAARYWEAEFQEFWSKSGFSWASLADHLMTACRALRVYDPGNIRGRGAWYDNGVPVLHIGNHLIVGGERQDLVLPGSKFVYEDAIPLVERVALPLSNMDANQLFKICGSLRWEKKVSGRLLAGWIALAPICGALNWRPAIWLTGAAGAGKSWIVKEIIRASLGSFSLYVKSKTTEPYLRQKLGSDALPVLFDEAEREDVASAARMKSVLELVRQASSDDDAVIGKGGVNGRPVDYRIRSMFCFQSINISITEQADASRISVLGLRDKSRDGDVAFEDLQVRAAEIITPQFSAGLIARSVSLIPVIRQNAEIFARALSVAGGSRRMGDQLGTLLAGAYSLHSTRLISQADAETYVANEDWVEEKSIDDDKDEAKLLRTLLTSMVRVLNVDAPVGRLIDDAMNPGENEEGRINSKIADRALREKGIKIGMRNGVSGVYISTNHQGIKSLLTGTPWDASWSKALSRLPDADTGKGILERFSVGHTSRAVWIPMSTIDPPGED